jgi:hypothetical protein
MFLVTEADADAIRAIFNQEGELSAAIELRRRFPGITDNAEARAHVRTIAGLEAVAAATVSRDPAASQRLEPHFAGGTRNPADRTRRIKPRSDARGCLPPCSYI